VVIDRVGNAISRGDRVKLTHALAWPELVGLTGTIVRMDSVSPNQVYLHMPGRDISVLVFPAQVELCVSELLRAR